MLLLFLAFFISFFLMFLGSVEATEPFDTWDFPLPRVLFLQEKTIYGADTAELYLGLTSAVTVQNLQVGVLAVQEGYVSAFSTAEVCASTELKAGELLKCRFILRRRRSFTLAAVRIQAGFEVANHIYSLYIADKIAQAHLLAHQREELLFKIKVLPSDTHIEEFRTYLDGRNFIPGMVDAIE